MGLAMTVGDLLFKLGITGDNAVQKGLEGVGQSATQAASDTETLSNAQEDVQGALRDTAQAADRAADAQEQVSNATGSATNVVTSFGDAVQDAAVAGPSAAANNLSFIVESFGNVASTAGGAAA